eukprot:TRINITY_DN5011_c0_g1_i9.p1 TRINITY_DN5011_c0_g1~~TRINITY_DN5011_c0_g1_i9.p1  ORF type:complete len:1480 (+),score=277.51 TRINITY_DN5011_c0_g1_i9:86-4525(+)
MDGSSVDATTTVALVPLESPALSIQSIFSTQATPKEQVAVYVRARPLLRHEDGQRISWKMHDDSLIMSVEKDTKCCFKYERVFWMADSNEQVFQLTSEEIVRNAIQGYNGSIIVYGQTSSGKTHTMFGSSSEEGFVSMSARFLFETSSQLNRHFVLRVSMLEIYNEVVNDLLNSAASGRNLNVREREATFYPENLTERFVHSIADLQAILREGETQRKVGVTNMNERSSRSHIIVRLIIEAYSPQPDDERVLLYTSTLDLVDLAGSETLTDIGNLTQKTETQHINKSLAQLKTVITSLSNPKKSRYVNYRDSCLTKILKQSLGGNAQTAIICTITPAHSHRDKTKMTLHFGNLARQIQNAPRFNQSANRKSIMYAYQERIQHLELQLSRYLSSDSSKSSSENMNESTPEAAPVSGPLGTCSEHIFVISKLVEHNRHLEHKLSLAVQEFAQSHSKIQDLIQSNEELTILLEESYSLIEAAEHSNWEKESKIFELSQQMDELHVLLLHEKELDENGLYSEDHVNESSQDMIGQLEEAKDGDAQDFEDDLDISLQHQDDDFDDVIERLSTKVKEIVSQLLAEKKELQDQWKESNQRMERYEREYVNMETMNLVQQSNQALQRKLVFYMGKVAELQEMMYHIRDESTINHQSGSERDTSFQKIVKLPANASSFGFMAPSNLLNSAPTDMEQGTETGPTTTQRLNVSQSSNYYIPKSPWKTMNPFSSFDVELISSMNAQSKHLDDSLLHVSKLDKEVATLRRQLKEWKNRYNQDVQLISSKMSSERASDSKLTLIQSEISRLHNLSKGLLERIHETELSNLQLMYEIEHRDHHNREMTHLLQESQRRNDLSADIVLDTTNILHEDHPLTSSPLRTHAYDVSPQQILPLDKMFGSPASFSFGISPFGSDGKILQSEEQIYSLQSPEAQRSNAYSQSIDFGCQTTESIFMKDVCVQTEIDYTVLHKVEFLQQQLEQTKLQLRSQLRAYEMRNGELASRLHEEALHHQKLTEKLTALGQQFIDASHDVMKYKTLYLAAKQKQSENHEIESRFVSATSDTLELIIGFPSALESFTHQVNQQVAFLSNKYELFHSKLVPVVSRLVQRQELLKQEYDISLRRHTDDWMSLSRAVQSHVSRMNNIHISTAALESELNILFQEKFGSVLITNPSQTLHEKGAKSPNDAKPGHIQKALEGQLDNYTQHRGFLDRVIAALKQLDRHLLQAKDNGEAVASKRSTSIQRRAIRHANVSATKPGMEDGQDEKTLQAGDSIDAKRGNSEDFPSQVVIESGVNSEKVLDNTMQYDIVPNSSTISLGLFTTQDKQDKQDKKQELLTNRPQDVDGVVSEQVERSEDLHQAGQKDFVSVNSGAAGSMTSKELLEKLKSQMAALESEIVVLRPKVDSEVQSRRSSAASSIASMTSHSRSHRKKTPRFSQNGEHRGHQGNQIHSARSTNTAQDYEESALSSRVVSFSEHTEEYPVSAGRVRTGD